LLSNPIARSYRVLGRWESYTGAA